MKLPRLRLAAALMSVLISACQTTSPETPSQPAVAGTGNAPATSASTSEPASKAGAKTTQGTQPGSAKPVENAATAPEAAPAPKPEQLFAEGKDLYEKGDYRNAIRKLIASRDAAEANSPLAQDSMKLLAFSYCVSGQKALCNAQFTSLLKIAPTFQLSRAEAGHPLWGPEFKKAKAATSATASKPAKKS